MMKMKVHPLVFLAMLPLFSCRSVEEKTAEPKVFKISPGPAVNEHGFMHELEVTLYCDVEYDAGMARGTWASIVSKEPGATNVIKMTVSLETNGTDASRTDTLRVTAGSKSLYLAITQEPAGNSFPQTEVTLEYTNPVSISLNLPADWSLELGNSPWLEYSPSSGAAGIPVTVSFRAKSLNFENIDRRATGRFDVSGTRVDFSVVQKTSVPGGDFASDVCGIYNYDGNGANLTYDESAHQTNLVKGASGNIFRLVNPSGNTFYELSGLPASYSAADSINFTMYQNWLPSLKYKTEVGAWVLQVDGSHVWLMNGDNVGFVIKK